MNLGQLFAYAAKKFPNNVALIYQQQKMSYKELFYRASLFADKLKEKGISRTIAYYYFLKTRLSFISVIMPLCNWAPLLRHSIPF